MPLFLFTGEESYLLQQELKKWTSSFIEKYGAYGYSNYAADALDLPQITANLLGGGMFSSKKLIIIKGVPADGIPHNKAKTSDIETLTNFFTKNKEQLDPDAIVVCVSYKPDKRTKWYKRFVENATVKEFQLLDDKQKAQIIEQHIPWLLTTAQKETLISSSGSDLHHLLNECNKLYHYAQYHKLNALHDDQIAEVSFWTAIINNFTILDHLYTDPTKAITIITDAQKSGQDMFQLLWMFYWWLKISIQLLNLVDNGIKDSKQLASALKAHPFVISKQLKILATLQQKKQKIYTFYSSILQIDSEIKTGVLAWEWFWIALKQAIMTLV